MKTAELIAWLQTLEPDSTVAIDEGGLTLVNLDSTKRNPTGEYLELGGWSEDDDDGLPEGDEN